MDYFKELNDIQKSEIDKISKTLICKNGDVVILQGEYCNRWIIVKEGSFLCRKRDSNDNVKEKIILEGDSFSVDSIFKKSIAEESLEAVEESSLLVIDLEDLKKLSRKKPELISLIKIDDVDFNADFWKKKRKDVIKIRESFIYTLLYSITFTPVVLIMSFIVPPIAGSLFIFWAIVTFMVYARKIFSYIEVSKDTISKKEIRFKKISAENFSIPLEKLDGTTTFYKNKILKIFKLGSISLKSPNGSLDLNGVFKPEEVLPKIKDFMERRKDLDKALEVASFKSVYCKKNGLFLFDNQIESAGVSKYKFRKSVIYLLARIIPSFIIFSALTFILFFLFRSYNVLFFNLPLLFTIIWYYWDWINDIYAFDGNRVIDIEKKPFWGSETKIELDLDSVQSVRKNQKHFLQIAFNYGDIEISTIGEKIVYPSINNPDKVIENLYLVKKYYTFQAESNRKMERQEEFLNYSKYYQELSK